MTLLTLENCTEAYQDLKLEYVYGSAKFWQVQEDIVILLSWGEVIVIESGFKTDLASVPRFLWGICPPFGDFLMAAIIHDWLYIHNKERSTTRKQADKELLIWMEALGPTFCFNKTYYHTVRLFGGSWWNHNHTWK